MSPSTARENQLKGISLLCVIVTRIIDGVASPQTNDQLNKYKLDYSG